MLLRVKSVKATPGHRLEILFTSGEVGLYVCSPLLDFGVFSEFKDERYFQQAHVVNGTVGWAARTGYLSGHALSGRDSAVILKRFQDHNSKKGPSLIFRAGTMSSGPLSSAHA